MNETTFISPNISIIPDLAADQSAICKWDMQIVSCNIGHSWIQSKSPRWDLWRTCEKKENGQGGALTSLM